MEYFTGRVSGLGTTTVPTVCKARGVAALWQLTWELGWASHLDLINNGTSRLPRLCYSWGLVLARLSNTTMGARRLCQLAISVI